jgi:putative oxygen-independent coproporphyrinogen III oxidase
MAAPSAAASAAAASRPDDPALADAAAGWHAAYVHIPFCARVCPYCDFAVVEGRDDLTDRYLSALTTEIKAEPEWVALDAVFVGGGTPSRLDPDLLGGVIDTLRDRFGLTSSAEVTLEANPEDWSPDRAERLRAGGFTRVSFGAQSFDPVVLEYLGRRHTPEQISGAVATARSAGFESISLDLIFGSPVEDAASWRATVAGAVDLAPDHLSAYALTVERGTPLSRAVNAGAPAPDPDTQADEYEILIAALESTSLRHYEVSNWAAPGHACRYNLTVWAQGEYLAFGTGAHRYRDGRRSWNVRRLDAYLDRLEAGDSPVSGEERLEGLERERERMFIGLRRTAGVRMGDVGRRWMDSGEVERLADGGILAPSVDRIVVVDPLRTDTAARSLMGLDLS